MVICRSSRKTTDHSHSLSPTFGTQVLWCIPPNPRSFFVSFTFFRRFTTVKLLCTKLSAEQVCQTLWIPLLNLCMRGNEEEVVYVIRMHYVDIGLRFGAWQDLPMNLICSYFVVQDTNGMAFWGHFLFIFFLFIFSVGENTWNRWKQFFHSVCNNDSESCHIWRECHLKILCHWFNLG